MRQGGDPGHLLSNDGFQTAAGGWWFVVRGCFGIERFRRGLAQSEFAPGIEAVDQSLINKNASNKSNGIFLRGIIF